MDFPTRHRKPMLSSAVLFLSIAHAGAAMAGGDGIVIAEERQAPKLERVVGNGEVCAEGDGYKLSMASQRTPDETYFQLDNLSGAPVFVYLMHDGASYWTDYPQVEVLFRSVESEVWSAPVISPGTFLTDGLERIPVDPGAQIIFRAPVSAYLPSSPKMVKLQIRFGIMSGDKEASACVSSAPFRVQPQDHGDANGSTQ